MKTKIARKKKKDGRGGARIGAGGPKKDPANKAMPKPLSITQARIDKALKLSGQKNLSKAIAWLIDQQEIL